MVHLSRRKVLMGLTLPLLGCVNTPHDSLLAREPIDLMPKFWETFDVTAGLPFEQRVAALLERFFQPNAATYLRAAVTTKPEKIARWLPEFDGIAVRVRALHQQLLSDYSSYVRRFTATFPDFNPDGAPVYLLPSLFGFDAHLEPDGSVLPLFFGLDGIVKYHGQGADLSVLFAHELFHCYHGQRRPEILLDSNPPLYASLWIEGLATYVSERLSPHASLLHVLLDDDQLTQRGPGVAATVARSLLSQLDSTADSVRSSLFSSAVTSDWPARSGYYVGLLAARILGQDLTLKQMASLPSAQVRAGLEAALRQISNA